MYELDPKYLSRLESLAAEIQESEELSKYLEEEEEEEYVRLKEMFEPRISLIYEEVAANHPLQLIPMELILLDDAFEGLYLPRILGYSVLRGEINERVKYRLPQNHFKEILLTICQSANFDILKKRIGQTIQIGFALSSDIWVTNLINVLENKRIRYFLQGQKLEKYRRDRERLIGYQRYKRQFKNDSYQTAEFPESESELPILFSPLKNFLIHRINTKSNNESIQEPLKKFVNTEAFHGTEEHMEIVGLYVMFFDMTDEDKEHVKVVFNKLRENNEEFAEKWLSFLIELHKRGDLKVGADADKHIMDVMDSAVLDTLKPYYRVLGVLHDKGYMNEETQETIKMYYNSNEGLSTTNKGIRTTVYEYFHQFITNLSVFSYSDFFEISKYFPIYMSIFATQQFNQDIKDLSMAYVHRLLKQYTDKRGKDYQDIKKFVSTTFSDLGFLKDKEIVELFKTRRKKKKEA